jgi:hypothetical protein
VSSPSPTEKPETRVAFWCLLVFTFILFIAPQTFIPGLAQLSPAKVTMVLGIVFAVAGRLGAGLPLTVWLPESKLILGLWLWGGLSIIWSKWPGGSYDLLTNEFGKSVVLFFVVTTVVNSAGRLRTLLASMVLWGMPVAATVIRDYFSGVLHLGRVAGFDSPLAANPNDAALVLDLLIALSIGLFEATRSASWRALIVLAMGGFALGVLVTFSRGGFIGLLVIIVVLALREWRRQWSRLIMLAGLGLLVGLLAPVGYGTRLSSIYDISSDPTHSAGMRWELMVESAKLIVANPLGGGLGQDVISLRDRGLATWNNVHNAYLQLGVDLGVVGLGIFVVVCWRLVRGLRRSLHALQTVPGTEPLHALGRGVEIALLVLLIQITMHPVAYHFYFYYIAGLAVAMQVMVGETTKRARGVPPERGRITLSV